MSLSLRDELRVVLLPDQVLLVRIGRRLSLAGIQYRVLEKKSVQCVDVDAGEDPWSAAIIALSAELPGFAGNAGGATVILSSHFMHYEMIPWNRELSSEEEELAYARHCFTQIYGPAAETWELRLSQDAAGAPQLASAVDVRLLEAVRGIFGQTKARLESIQPYLMAAYNNSRHRLQNQNGWFVVFEAGSLCIALLQQGNCRAIRTLKADSDWRATLPLILERQAYLTEVDAATDQVFVWAPEYGETPVPVGGQWKVKGVRPVIRPGFMTEYDARYALAMGA